MLAERLKIKRPTRRRRHAGSSEEPKDRWTGYYVAGLDWPAQSNKFSIPDLYEALEEIGDDDVHAAVSSLQGASPDSSAAPDSTSDE